jgi:SAM-dependent methyltransferase
MDRAEYLKMHEVEERMWWYRGCHANLLTAHRNWAPALPSLPVLDAGCGTGGFLVKLGAALPGVSVLGLDLAPDAAELAAQKSGAAICVGSIDELPFASGSLGAIFSADVLYHRDVDEGRALADLYRCLAPGGVLVLNLPAYDWLRSAHDQAVHTARRYTRARLRQRLRDAGFQRIRTSYWNMLLFPVMVLRRKLFTTSASTSDVMIYPAPIEILFRAALGLETLALRSGLSLPFGGSVLAAAVKHG